MAKEGYVAPFLDMKHGKGPDIEFLYRIQEAHRAGGELVIEAHIIGSTTFNDCVSTENFLDEACLKTQLEYASSTFYYSVV